MYSNNLVAVESLNIPFGIGRGRRNLFSHSSLDMSLFFDRSKREILGTVRFGTAAEGPPGHAHGGLSSFVLDEVMGTLGWAASFPVVARKIEVELISMIPVGADIVVTASIEACERKSLRIRASLKRGDVVLSQSIGHFYILSPAQIMAIAQSNNVPMSTIEVYLKGVKEYVP